MNTTKMLFFAAVASATLSFGAFAQENAAKFALPEQCTTGSGMAGAGHSAMGQMAGQDGESQDGGMMGMGGMDMDDMTDAQRANMEKMMATMPAMHQGMMNEDPNIAFACGMIAHHTAAINMAEVELEFGKDEFLRDRAQRIIDDQKQRITEMTEWLSENGE